MIEITLYEAWRPRDVFIGISVEKCRKYESSGFVPAGTMITNKLEIAAKYGGVILAGNVIFNNLEPYKNSKVLFITQIDVPVRIVREAYQPRRPLEFFYKFFIKR
jgi:hypothetical protein